MTDLNRTQRRVVGLGLVCLAVGAWASIWCFFASQSPSSPFHVAFLPGPVRRFAFWALALGVVLPVIALLLPAALPDPKAQRRFSSWLLVGALLKILGLGLGAAWSAYGIQIIDPRPESVIVMSLRITGEAILLVAVSWLAVVWFRRGRQPG